MSTPATPVVTVPAAPTKPLTAIQIIENELNAYAAQHAKAVSTVHAIEGAIQGGQILLAKLKAAESAAVAEGKKLLGEVEAEVEKAGTDVKTESSKAVTFIKKEL